MKKLFLVLALLILGSFASQGAFAVCDPNTDRFGVHGWCVDNYGTLTPKAMTTSSQQIASKGGKQEPVNNITASYTTYDTLSSQQTGLITVDMGGQTANSGVVGSGGEHILPLAAPGLFYTFIVGSLSTITIDTLTNADSILLGAQTSAGNGIKNSSKTTSDSITLVSNAAGSWVVAKSNGTWITTGAARIH